MGQFTKIYKTSNKETPYFPTKETVDKQRVRRTYGIRLIFSIFYVNFFQWGFQNNQIDITIISQTQQDARNMDSFEISFQLDFQSFDSFTPKKI